MSEWVGRWYGQLECGHEGEEEEDLLVESGLREEEEEEEDLMVESERRLSGRGQDLLTLTLENNSNLPFHISRYIYCISSQTNTQTYYNTTPNMYVHTPNTHTPKIHR